MDYDNFLRISQYSRVLALIANFGTALDFLSGVQGGIGLYTKEISEANDALEAQVNIVNGALALIPGDDGLKEEQLDKVAEAFGNNFAEAKTAAYLISDLNAQLNESGGLGDFVNVFTGSVQGIFTNAVFLWVWWHSPSGIKRLRFIPQTLYKKAPNLG